MKTDTLVISEIYASIQGESSFAGEPCTFVRLTGCNLRCSWCDSPHSFYGGRRLGRDEVLAQALAFDTPLIELTGGEPLLQPGSIPLLSELCDSGRTILIETSGERDVSQVDPRVHKIMDLKAPGSGESHRNRWENLTYLGKQDEIKIVLKDQIDYTWAREVIIKEHLADRVGHVLLSTVHGELSPKDVVAWILQDKLPVRFQLQMHKFIWSPETLGV